MKKADRQGLRTWIEIDKGAIRHNYAVFRRLIPKSCKLLGVVKSNAYGHNLLEFGRELEKLGADYLAVDSAVEGISLRKEGVKIPILVLGYTLPEMIESAVLNNLEITVSNFDYFSIIKKLNLKSVVNIHIKVDTGMHRHGFQPDEIARVLTEISKLNNRPRHQNDTPSSTDEGGRSKPAVTVVGLFTHFASAKNPTERRETKKQIEIFMRWQKAFGEVGLKVISHACATSGTAFFPEAHFDMVRVGIGMYGIGGFPGLDLKPVLSWKTIIGEINKIKKGEKIGYDFTEKLKKDSLVAVCPVGYWHGLPRALSSVGQVIVAGQKCKILGRVCMDIIMVDVTGVRGAKTGTEVTLIGQDDQEEISVDDLATLLKASPYEVVTRINPLIKKFYI